MPVRAKQLCRLVKKEPCKPGQTAAQTGCIPARGTGWGPDRRATELGHDDSMTQQGGRLAAHPLPLGTVPETNIRPSYHYTHGHGNELVMNIGRPTDAQPVVPLIGSEVEPRPQVPAHAPGIVIPSPKRRPSSVSKRLLATSPIVSEHPIGDRNHKNQATVMVLEDGTQGVFKSERGENHLLRNAVPHQYLREAAASDVADILGFGDLVPATTLRKDEDGYEGSIQEFVDDAQNAWESADEIDPLSSDPDYDGAEDAARTAVFDYITGQMDRHGYNWLLKNGKIALIDNGLSFPTQMNEYDYANNRDLWWAKANQEDWETPDLTSYAGKWPEVEAALKQNRIEPEAIELTRDRFFAATSGKYRHIADLPFYGKPLVNKTLGQLARGM